MILEASKQFFQHICCIVLISSALWVYSPVLSAAQSHDTQPHVARRAEAPNIDKQIREIKTGPTSHGLLICNFLHLELRTG
jgi:hypothetical protein